MAVSFIKDPVTRPVCLTYGHIKLSWCYCFSFRLEVTHNIIWNQCLLFHQPSPGRLYYYSDSSGDATGCIKLHWNIFFTLHRNNVAVSCNTACCHQSCCSSGSLLRCENHKGTGACLLPLLNTRSFCFHGYLAPISPAKCKWEKRSSRSIALLSRLHPSRRCFIFVSSSSGLQWCSASLPSPYFNFFLFERETFSSFCCWHFSSRSTSLSHTISVRGAGEMRQDCIAVFQRGVFLWRRLGLKPSIWRFSLRSHSLSRPSDDAAKTAGLSINFEWG